MAFDSAEALLDELTNSAFRPPSEDRVYPAPFFGELPPVWAFRGQRDAEWKLTPASLRDNAFAMFTGVRLTDESEYQQTEWTLVMHEFRQLADEFGHHFPGDSMHLRCRPPRYEPSSFGPDRSTCITADFPSANEIQAFTLAQHFGIPSRTNADFRVLFPSAPTFGNPNMAAQQGLFSLVNMAEVSRPLDLETAVATFKAAEQFPLSRPVLYKYTCLANQSRRLLKQLANYRISAAHLFPGLAGIVKWMRERRVYE